MNREITLALNYALNKGIQIHPDAFKILVGMDAGRIERVIKDMVREKSREGQFQINKNDLEAYLGIVDDPLLQGDVRVWSDPTGSVATGEGVSGYNALFASRFNKLKQIILMRPEAKMLKTAAAASSSKSVKPDDDLYVCGLVTEISSNRNRMELKLEDPSGSFKAAIYDSELQKTADTLLLDQFVMVKVGRAKSGHVVKDLIFPDIPDHSPNKAKSDVYAVFLSDLHVGSRYFMEEEFARFVSWLSSPDAVARKIRFVLIAGDIVDGVGIYPNQDKELVCQTIEEQLAKVEDMIDRIPKNIKIIIMPGNHDPGRRALPQPAIPKKHNSGLWERDNVIMVGNPSVVSLNGVKVLMFHGQSVDDIVKITPGLSYDKPANVMKHLLKARHLSPIYGSQTPIAPEMEDHMVIEDIPDIFHAGHVHKAELDMYRGVLVINSGCWQRQTPFQMSVGITPNPCMAFVVNLKTFRVLVSDYMDSDDVVEG